MKKRPPRPVRVDRIGRARAIKSEKRAHGKKPLRRRGRRSRVKKLIAYDLETTPIAVGSPRPLYLTAYGAEFHYSGRLNSVEHLGEILRSRFLVPELAGHRFIAWNGNQFDVYFIGAALLHFRGYVLRPYLTRGKNLRGLKVTETATKHTWEFLDGISMTGVQKPLKDFLKVFAPDFQKLEAPNFDNECFNADNPAHVAYAERDSEGLYHAMANAAGILKSQFGLDFAPTIGNTGIKIFQAHMPEHAVCWRPPFEVADVIHRYVMRGGYCFCQRRYEGPIWKYDINQAYAAAMRDTWLPAGSCVHFRNSGFMKYAGCAIYRCRARHRHNTIPFYYRDLAGDGVFAMEEISETWLTSIEVGQLIREGWAVDILDTWYWTEQFKMKAYVDKLEALRMGAADGPAGSLGTMCKSIGNNSYGKTAERLGSTDLVLALEPPEGYHEYQSENDLLRHVWFKFSESPPREYHQPQLAAFITAHVRMVVRRAALLDPAAWLYADTDSVIYSHPVALPLHASKYGLWKVECEGVPYRIITKKVYAKVGGGEAHAKGMTVRRLTDADFAAWYAGRPPEQKQVQRASFLKVMTGADMFLERIKVGQIIAPAAA